MKTNHSPTAATLAAALAAGLLAACQPAQEGRTAAAPPAERTSPSAMADKAADAISDAAITVAVNAELAKDAQLSALRIDVDTVDGRVALAGTAPDEVSRDRATQLAQRVEGVKAVDNRLTVSPRS